jgi:starch synthase
MLNRRNLLGRFFTGFRLKPGSVIERYMKLSIHRALDESLATSTTQIWGPELFGKAAQTLGWRGERLMRVRNGWFQKLIPNSAIAASDAVIGFDTSSWILARRSQELGKPFILDRTAVHRATRASILATLDRSGGGVPAAMPKPNDVQDTLESKEFALASKVVVASRFTERSLLDAGVAAEKIAVIPYGVDERWFGDRGKHARCAGKTIFLFVGNITIEKGIGVLLTAWRQLKAPDAELWLVGGGAGEALRMAEGVAGVRVLGKLGPEALREVYLKASAFVFPTYFDGFGLVLLEAMASGLPIIATPNCAAPDLIKDGEAGRIFPVGDSASLCSAMEDVCLNLPAWVRKGDAAREIARSYLWEAYGSRYADMLREMLA